MFQYLLHFFFDVSDIFLNNKNKKSDLNVKFIKVFNKILLILL